MKGYIHLYNGDCFQGEWLTGAPNSDTQGEIVFFTGMTGYEEALTDPSYKDKIIVFTYPLIGNYGISEANFECKKPQVAGVIVYEAREHVFHYEAKYSLVEYLYKWGIPMLGHVDTRAVVKKIRSSQTMPAVLSSSNEIDENSLYLVPNKEIKKWENIRYA